MHHNTSTTSSLSTLANLRSLIPTRDSITFTEALRIAELQAAKLLTLLGIDDGPVPREVITELPRIKVDYANLPVSGTSHWNGRDWIITLNTSESYQRKRFTLAHEYKHIIDHGHAHRLYRGTPRSRASQQSEQAADYFAGCLLVPRKLLKRAWGNGIQDPLALARHFQMSVPAISIRLAQTGLAEGTERCARPIHTRRGERQAFYAVGR